MAKPLSGRRIALPEHRELDRLAAMLEAQGAEAVRCPLVAIADVADLGAGAGVGRAADRPALRRPDPAGPARGAAALRGGGARGVGEGFVAALGKVRKITRGPKPGAALRVLKLKEDVRAATPTTEGVVETLSKEDLQGRRVGVQLYPDNPNARLIDFLRGAGAEVDAVVPYAYASDADDRRVAALIDELAAGRVDAIAFTSSPQIKRLFGVCERSGPRGGIGRGARADRSGCDWAGDGGGAGESRDCGHNRAERAIFHEAVGDGDRGGAGQVMGFALLSPSYVRYFKTMARRSRLSFGHTSLAR